MADPPVAPVPLHARDEGEGPAVLLIHGLGADHTVWNAQIGPLAKRYRVLAPDLRGHGRSPMPPGSTLSFPEIIADLRMLLDERGIPDAHVGGISAGAFVALRWATQEPGRFRSLVLCGGATHCDAHSRAVGRSWREAYRSEGFDACFLRLVKDVYAAEWIEANLESLDGMKSQWKGRDYAAAFLWGQSIESFDLRGRLSGMKVPTLILHGLDDKVVDVSHARLMRQSLPGGAQMRLFALTGHMVPVERPAEATEALEKWLASRESGASASPPP
ncbi:MAG TPA: alpha/beta fold hydrolase [Thermoplasmata archaeon]|nr:alpha/beta fold hydrolase [Thermoplasmata archaeon]